jgi:hypothetical protein
LPPGSAEATPFGEMTVRLPRFLRPDWALST